MQLNGIREVIKNKKADLALFYNIDSDRNDKNMIYFSGYHGLGCLVIPIRKDPFLIVPLMEVERARKASRIKVYEWQKRTRLFESLHKILVERKVRHKRIAADFNAFNLNAYTSIKKVLNKPKLCDISIDCLKLRAIKSSQEISLLKKSCGIADEIIGSCIKRFNEFRTETDVVRFLTIETYKKDCKLAFAPIVASGSSSSMPHYEPKNTAIKKGFCVIDFGVIYEGYHSDITRTIYVGKPSEEEINHYELLLKVQRNVIQNIKAGKKCKDSYDEALIGLREHSDKMVHGLGHGIGLDIHELPNLTSLSEETYREKMVFTVEPGIYMPGKYGIRIEDDILIANNKSMVLTKTPKKLTIIKRDNIK